jgi:sodium-dependent dicarboxylate transporter 2/3/5
MIQKKKRILDEKSFNEVNWGIVLLLGGGFGLAYGITKSGLSSFIGQKLLLLKDIPIFLILLIINTICIFLTELTSNTSVVAITIPILAELSITVGQNPLLLCIPTTIICSYAFMLPISTAPNAIIFATNKLKVSEMAKTGLALNIFGIIVITFGSYLLKGIWEINIGELPDWVNKTVL